MRPHEPTATRCSRGCGPQLEPPAGRLLRRRCAPAPTTATSRRSTAVRLAVAAPLRPRHRAARGLPARVRQGRHARASCVEDLTAALTPAIEELTRPVDAIKHQAKTVTVGISRSDETLLQVAAGARGARRRRAARPAQLPHAAHAGRPRPGRGRGRRLHPLPHRGRRRRRRRRHHRRRRPGRHRRATCPSRTDRDPTLRGTKHRVATEREVARGPGPQRRPHRSSSCPRSRTTRPPASRCCTSRFPTGCRRPRCAGVLQGYRDRYARPARRRHRDRADLPRRPARPRSPVVDLLTEPVHDLADRWRSG